MQEESQEETRFLGMGNGELGMAMHVVVSCLESIFTNMECSQFLLLPGVPEVVLTFGYRQYKVSIFTDDLKKRC